MFRFVGDLPKQPDFTPTLAAFEYHVSDGKLISRQTGSKFNFYHSSDESLNHVRKEAFHQAVRREIIDMLGHKGVVETFLLPSIAEPLTVKPQSGVAHTSILTTNLLDLKQKTHIIVVIGESTQDPGIWSWREVTSGGTLRAGSALGLVEDLARRCPRNPETSERDVQGSTNIPFRDAREEKPGLVILNPGQTLYSHKLLRALTFTSWNDRNTEQCSYNIHDQSNRIPGHVNEHEHVATCFTRVLPQIINDEARIHLICIGDGSEAILSTFDRKKDKDGSSIPLDRIVSIAFVQPTHDPRLLVSQELKDLLSEKGRSWIQSDRTRGELLSSGLSDTMPAEDAPAISRLEQSMTAISFQTTNASTEETSSEKFPDHAPDYESAIAQTREVELNEEQDYVYEPEPVSCPTYSAGISGVDKELVFPHIQKDVLTFIIDRIEQCNKSA